MVLFKVCNIFQTFKLNFATMPIDVMIFHFDLSATYCNIIYQYWYLVASLFQLLQTKVDKYNYERWHFTFNFLLSQNLERWYLNWTKKRSKSWNNWKIKYVTLHTKLWKSIPSHFCLQKTISGFKLQWGNSGDRTGKEFHSWWRTLVLWQVLNIPFWYHWYYDIIIGSMTGAKQRWDHWYWNYSSPQP